MRETFVPRNFNGSSLVLIEQAVAIITEMQAKGYTLTVRQLYYQFVTRNWLANTDKNYKRLASIINDARLAGIIDWDAIIDRTRFLRSIPTYDSPKHFLRKTVPNYAHDIWRDQKNYCEVWIEKDALIGVIENPCNRLRVPYYSCRGYGSQSEMYEAGKRIKDKIESDEQFVTIFCLSDHDPSGINMTEDIEARLNMFVRDYNVEGLAVRRVALNMDQIREYNPPPNPAKETDSRFNGYNERFGDSSWELDSLDPEVIDNMVTEAIESVLDQDAFDESVGKETAQRDKLDNVMNHFNELSSFLTTGTRPIV